MEGTPDTVSVECSQSGTHQAEKHLQHDVLNKMIGNEVKGNVVRSPYATSSLLFLGEHLALPTLMNICSLGKRT